jgi:hypothetical protein
MPERSTSMIEFITPSRIWALDGTEPTEDECTLAQSAIQDFADEARIKTWRMEARPHGDGFVAIVVEFIGFATSPELCVQKEQEIQDGFQQFLVNRGYKPRLLN